MKILTKAERIAQARRDLSQTLARVGYKGKVRRTTTLKLDPVSKPAVPTSDKIPGNGSKREANQYTGTEIAGIALNHKQNYEPIRRDNLKAAVDSAQMRRS
jgi:hypothetical protein